MERNPLFVKPGSESRPGRSHQDPFLAGLDLFCRTGTQGDKRNPARTPGGSRRGPHNAAPSDGNVKINANRPWQNGFDETGRFYGVSLDDFNKVFSTFHELIARQVRRIENGESPITLQSLEKFTTALGMTAEQIMEKLADYRSGR